MDRTEDFGDDHEDQVETRHRGSSEANLWPSLKSHVIFVGGTKSGKTYRCLNIIKNVLRWKFDECYIYCPTYDSSRWKTTLLGVDPKNIFKKFDERKHDQLLKDLRKKYEKADGDYACLIIMDDCARHLQRSEVLANSLSTDRHSNIIYMILAQDIKFLDMDTRQQMHNFIVFPVTSEENVKRVAEGMPNVGYRKFKKAVEYAKTRIASDGDRYAYLFTSADLAGKVFYANGKKDGGSIEELNIP
jgi:hypothetical protein